MKITLDENEEVQIVPLEYGRAKDPIEVVQEYLPQEELLCQLAEECSELAKAALKLRRAYNEVNPTPVKPSEAYNNLLEEIADAKLCLLVAGYERADIRSRCNRIMEEKADRWAQRLEMVDK